MGRRRHDDLGRDVGAAPAADVAEMFEAVVRRVASDDKPLARQDRSDIRLAGAKAAEHGMTASEAVDLYLRTVASTWEIAPLGSGQEGSGRAVIDAMRAAVPMLLQGYQNGGQSVLRQEEGVRAEFIDDLLRGDVDVASMVQRVEPFGFDLSASHQVVLAASPGWRTAE